LLKSLLASRPPSSTLKLLARMASTWVFLLAVQAQTALATNVSPIGKVLEMISDLQAKVISEGEDSHKVFSEFAELCEDRSRQLGFSIKTAEGQIGSLKATIAKEVATSEELDTKIGALAAEIATDTADLKAATEIRAKEQVDFAAEEKELVEVVDTITRAKGILEREMAKSGSASMLQLRNAGTVADALKVMVQASVISSTDASKLTALVQSAQQQEADDEDADLGAPDAAVYEGHSGGGAAHDGIIGVLEDLLEKAEGQLDGLRKAETSSLQNFEVLSQSLKDEIKNGNTDMSDAKKGLANSQAGKAEAEGDLRITSQDMSSDAHTKADLHADCQAKAEDFEAEQKSRAEELKALAEAKKVIEETTSGAEGQSYGLGQVSLFQTARSALSSGADLARFESVRFVQELAQKQNSTMLAQLAMRMASAVRVGASTGEDPFAKVKTLISEMIAKLEDEAAGDAEHKAYCDKELSENDEKEADKVAEIEKMTTKIDQWSARSAQLKDEAAQLQAALAELASTQAEMMKLRQKENALYKKNRAEMEEGLEGVKLGLKILNEYYDKEGKAHVAADGAGGGVIGLLEVIESDFSKNLAEIVSSEEAAQADYDQESKDNELETTNKQQNVKYKTQESKNLDKETAEHKSDRQGVQKELDAVRAVLKSLHSQCDETTEPYAEQKRRREAEIQGLKQALDILEGEAVLLQSSRRLRAVHQHHAPERRVI